MVLRRRSVLMVALVLVAAAGCTSSRPASNASDTAETSVPPTSQPPQPIVGWAAGPLAPPLEADDNALIVLAGDPPSDVSQDQALAVAQHVVGDAVGGLSMARTFAGVATLSPQLVQIGPGVPDITNAAAWVIAYRNRAPVACPSMTSTSIPSTASDLDAVIITGPGPDQVTVYHGTGTGPCIPSTSPVALSATRP